MINSDITYCIPVAHGSASSVVEKRPMDSESLSMAIRRCEALLPRMSKSRRG